MILTIDIGNSHITLGIFDGDELKFTARIATNRLKTADQYAIELNSVLRLHKASPDDINGAIISSVVPELGDTMKDAAALITGTSPIIVGPGIKTGLDIRIENPSQLGADLAVGAVAALKYYKMPCIIFDLGTATTVSVLGKNGEFLGGTISAGVGISLNALTSGTSLLQKVSLKTPKKVIGTNTVESMQAGLVLGAAAMLDGLTARIERELGEKATLVATGGLAPEIIKNCEREMIFNNDLLLLGLKIIYDKNRK